MNDPSMAIQAAVEAELIASAAVKAAFPGGKSVVYTLSAPNKAKYPYLIIGEDQVLGDDTDCASSSETTVTVHVWARADTPAESRMQAKALAAAVRGALSQDLVLNGHGLDDWTYDSTRHLTDPDALTAHSVVTLTYATTANP